MTNLSKILVSPFFVICTALFSGNNLWTGNRIEIVFNFSLITETNFLMDVRIRSLFRNCVLLPSHFLNMVGVWKPSFHYTILTMSFKTVQVHWSILKFKGNKIKLYFLESIKLYIKKFSWLYSIQWKVHLVLHKIKRNKLALLRGGTSFGGQGGRL